MFNKVANHASQRRALADSIFESPQVPKHINKLQRIRRIIRGVLEEICNNNFEKAQDLINGLPSESFKRQTRTIIQKIGSLNHQLNNAKIVKEETEKIAKALAEEAGRLKQQIEENYEKTVLRSQSNMIQQRVLAYQAENEDLKKWNEELKQKNKDLMKIKEKLMIENAYIAKQCNIKQSKLVEFKDQVCKLAHQNHELKLRSNIELPRQEERLESSIIPSQPNRSLLHREAQAQQVNQQIDKNNSQINECVLGPGQKWQLRSNNSMVTISIKESDPAEAEHIQYYFMVRIEKKVKSGVTERSKIQVEEDNKARRNSDAP